ncbi:MAG: peptidylprolyl isomerase [Desulfuromonadales bacterium]|nr:peptidylprolyl isomerase [Desulfuromonadales bacterium]
MKRVLVVCLMLFLYGCAPEGCTPETPVSKAPEPEVKVHQVLLETNFGNIKLELYEDKAPISVKNFLAYAEQGHYAGTIFHRVIQNFMIQGGNFDAEMNPKQPMAPIKNEATNGLLNQRGTIAMARTNAVDSATSQFFINLKDNDFLNHKDTGRGYGYAVFGKVIEGMDVVDRIGASPTSTYERFRDVPVTPVMIKNVTRVGEEVKAEAK